MVPAHSTRTYRKPVMDIPDMTREQLIINIIIHKDMAKISLFFQYFNQIMKWTSLIGILLIVSLLTAQAKIGFSQGLDTKISIELKNISLKDALKKISKDTHIQFAYSSSQIPANQAVNYTSRSEELGSVLEKILTPLGLTFQTKGTLVLVKKAENFSIQQQNNQSRIMRGTVKDENDEPFPGVSVSIVGANQGAITDLSGKFMLEMASGHDSLQFKYIGYRTKIVYVGNLGNMTVQMEPDLESQKLNEVVIVGFGKQKKVSVTGAISSVSMNEVAQISTPAISNAIAGKLPGIITRQSSGEPGFDAAKVFIRGIGTYGTNQEPLVLVDGIERDMNNINTEEIESFSILKDASATAVYGVRGANGVILINTKRGKIGKPKVTFRAETARLSPLRLPKYIDGAEYAGLINEALGYADQEPQFSEEDIELFRNGSDPFFHPNVDWTHEILKSHTHQTINNLNISGGTQTVRYFTNVGFTLMDGIYKTDNLNAYNTNALIKRYNFRSNVDIDLAKNFTVELGLGGIIQYGNYPGSGTGTGTGADAIFDALRITSPIMFPIRNPDGSPGGVLNFLGSNPWGEVTQSGYIRQDRNVLQGTFDAKWDLSDLVTKGLTVRGKFGYDHYYRGDQVRRKQFEVKEYLGKDPDGNDVYNVLREATALGYNVSNTINRRLYLEGGLNYNRSFDKHDISGMLLFNMAENIDLNAATSIGNLPKRRQGIAGRATYGFNNTYFIELNFGYNGSENFPKEKRFGFFPSVSGGWVLSNERFWGLDFVNQMKIRGSYGLVGNDEIGQRFLFVSRINRGADGYRFGDAQQIWSGFAEGFIANPDVTWEVAKKGNIGFDLGLLNDQITLQVDAFRDIRDHILTQRRTVPYVAGYAVDAVPYANLGKVKNQGVDASLEIKHATTGGLFYSVRGNFTFAKNKILENDQPIQRYPYLTEAGNPVGQPFGLEAVGLFKDQEDIDNSPLQNYSIPRPGDIKYKDQNGDDVINDFDKVPIGYPRVPEISFGFGGTLAYKGFDFSAFFNGATRTSIFIDGRSIQPFNQGFGSGTVLREYYDNRWTPDNPDGHYPRVLAGNSPNNFRQSTYYQHDGSYIRLRNAEIGYTIPKHLIQRFGIETIRVFINGTNLYTWDKIKIIDPESDNGIGRYPLQQSFNLGLLVNF